MYEVLILMDLECPLLTAHLGHQVADCGRMSRANRQPLKRINRAAAFIHNSTASSGGSPRPIAAKSQVQQIQASPAMTRCRFASAPLDCASGADLGMFRRKANGIGISRGASPAWCATAPRNSS